MIRRASGILLHITSLPSPFGIGDLGPAAYRFADFLAEAKQSFWQVLPLNPTVLALGNSPYSSPSVFAGNPLLISPESLVKDGFLSRSDLEHSPPLPVKVDYPAVLRHKTDLLRTAYQTFKKREERDYEFDLFCRDHFGWLEDYALFVALADHLGDLCWSRWPSAIKNRKSEEIDKIKRRFWERIEMEKFLQYLFFKQWFGLKRSL